MFVICVYVYVCVFVSVLCTTGIQHFNSTQEVRTMRRDRETEEARKRGKERLRRLSVVAHVVYAMYTCTYTCTHTHVTTATAYVRQVGTLYIYHHSSYAG